MDFFHYYLFPAFVEGRQRQWNHSGNYDYILADKTREYGIYAQGDGVYLYKRGYEGEPILLGQE